MKVIFDCRYTRFERHDGISRYTAGLVEAFSKLHPVTMLISDDRQLKMLPDLPWIKSRPATSLLEPWIALLTLNREHPDVVFSPMQTIGSVGRRFALVLTLHDMVFYRTRTPPKEFSWAIRAGWWAFHLYYWPQRITLNRADAVVTGSYNCEREMREVSLTKRPITVIRPGVPDSGAPLREYPKSKKLVYMGTFMPNKNVETLAAGMHFLPGYHLHLLSRIGDEARARLTSLAPDGAIVFENGVSDEEYRAQLRDAVAMVSACRDEGFGIPLIEAMIEGTPLVISDIPVFREVGGPAATFFDQESPRAFADAVLAMDNENDWERQSTLAREQGAVFNWEVGAKALFSLLSSLVEDSQETALSERE
ncbi:MAG: glycosyltransferase family 1 protein [Lacisediminihabitans sp.]